MTDQVHPLLRNPKPAQEVTPLSVADAVIDVETMRRPRSQDLSQQNRMMLKVIRGMIDESELRVLEPVRRQQAMLETVDKRVFEFAACQERNAQTIARLSETVRRQQELIKTVHARMFQFGAWQDATVQTMARDEMERTVLEETIERQRQEAGRAEEERETLRAECVRLGAELARMVAASTPLAKCYAVGREVRVWYADRKRYFEGRILAHLGEHEYRIAWSHQKKPEVVTLAPEHETRDQGDDDRFHLL